MKIKSTKFKRLNSLYKKECNKARKLAISLPEWVFEAEELHPPLRK